MSFHELGLSSEICRALTKLGYSHPTSIQTQAIPLILQGRDLLAGAQTGTGKTAAFALPILERLLLRENAKPRVARRARALVLTPTRELAAQVNEALQAYGQFASLRSAAVFGGVGFQPQANALRQGLDVMVATPGRLLDHMKRKTVDLSGVEILILDEADRMLDMGFLPDLRRILRAVPLQRQTLLFSATLPNEIKKLAADFMRTPAEVQVAAHNSVATTVSHRIHHVPAERKRELLAHLLMDEGRQTLVFCRTKRGADRLCRHLRSEGFSSTAIHGDRSQNERTRALQDFKCGRTRVLVATDIAARGLDIDQLPLVINFDLPLVAGDYIHRVGRTGRAGTPGEAVSLVCSTEHDLLHDIQRLLACRIETASAAGFDLTNSTRTGKTGRGGPSDDLRRPARDVSRDSIRRAGARPRNRRMPRSPLAGPGPRARGRFSQREPRVSRAGQYEDHSWLVQVL